MEWRKDKELENSKLLLEVNLLKSENSLSKQEVLFYII